LLRAARLVLVVRPLPTHRTAPHVSHNASRVLVAPPPRTAPWGRGLGPRASRAPHCAARCTQEHGWPRAQRALRRAVRAVRAVRRGEWAHMEEVLGQAEALLPNRDDPPVRECILGRRLLRDRGGSRERGGGARGMGMGGGGRGIPTHLLHCGCLLAGRGGDGVLLDRAHRLEELARELLLREIGEIGKMWEVRECGECPERVSTLGRAGGRGWCAPRAAAS
jgi:hypothetical protein